MNRISNEDVITRGVTNQSVSIEKDDSRIIVIFCKECFSVLLGATDTIIPMGLANDNWWGYTTEILWKYQVRWIELAIASPCFTSMMVLYVEGDYGHLMNEVVGKQQNRTIIKGSLGESGFKTVQRIGFSLGLEM